MNSAVFPITVVPISYARNIAILCSIFLFFSYATVSLRIWTRVFILRNLGSDDIFMLITLLSFTCICILLTCNTYQTVNKPAFTESEITVATNVMLAIEMFYIVTIALFKISLGLFFLRVLSQQKHRQIVYGVLVVFSLWSTVYLLFAIFQCGIPSGSHFWQHKISNQCVPDRLALTMGYIHAILTTASDIIFVSIPIPMVLQAGIDRREKLIIPGIFTLAIIGCVASLIRIKYIPVLVEKDAAFWKNSIFLSTWSIIEPGLGIIASSIVTLRPLLTKVGQRVNLSRSTSRFSCSIWKRSEATNRNISSRLSSSDGHRLSEVHNWNHTFPGSNKENMANVNIESPMPVKTRFRPTRSLSTILGHK